MTLIIRYFLLLAVGTFGLQAPQVLAQSKPAMLVSSLQQDKGKLFKIRNRYYLLGVQQNRRISKVQVSALNRKLKLLWSNTYSFSNHCVALDLVEGNNNNLFIAGTSYRGNSSLLIEIDKQGKLRKGWKLGRYFDRLKHIIKTQEGGFLYYGEIEGLGPKENMVALIKYDAQMRLEWKYYYNYLGSNDYERRYEMYGMEAIEQEDQSFWVLGSYAEVYNARKNRKIRLLKISRDGDLKWVKGFHGGQADRAMSMSKCPDEGVVIAANTNSYSNAESILLIKTDRRGNLDWAKNYSIKGGMVVNKIRILPNDKGYLVCGYTKRVGFGAKDALVMKIGPGGKLLQAKTFGGHNDDEFANICFSGKKVMLTGNSNSFKRQGIYLVTTDYAQLKNGCSFNLKKFISEKSVQPVFYEGVYSRGTFRSPSPVTVRVAALKTTQSIVKVTPCTNCPENTTKTYKFNDKKPFQLNFQDSRAISYKWQDGSTQPTYNIKKTGNYWVEVNLGYCQYRIVIKVTSASEAGAQTRD